MLGFFNIPFPNHPALLELQDFLRTKLPPEAAWQDPATFHLTLVAVDEGDEAALREVAWPRALTLFGIGGGATIGLTGPEGTAVALEMERAPQLIYLQAALFYELRAAGAVLKPTAWPGLWRPHITLARLPVGAGLEDIWSPAPAPVHLTVERFALSSEGYTEIASFALQTSGPSGERVREMATLRDVLVVGEFRGTPPDVPLIAGVNLAELTAGDADPMFVTLPIAKADVISDNQRYYDAEFVRVLREQIRTKRPGGLRGHLRDDERASAFPLPEAHWVGEALVGDTLWGKGYVPSGPFREYVRRLKASGAKLATSLYGTSEFEWLPERGVWRVKPETFELESVDFAPPERAGIRDLAVVPHVTAEMAGQSEEETEMDRTEVIRELKAEDAVLLPETVRAAVIAVSGPAKALGELRAALGVDEQGDVAAAAQALVAEMATLRAAAVDAAIAAAVGEAVKVEAARPVVIELVKARAPRTAEAVKTVVAEVVDGDVVKTLLGQLVVETMGGAQRRPVQAADGQGDGQQPYVIIPKDPAGA